MEYAGLSHGRDMVFDRIFYPAAIAVVGVSSRGLGFGSGIIVSLNAIGFAGEIYPVNPRGGEFQGLKIYRDVSDIPGKIDLAIIAVKAEFVPGVLEACRLKGAAGAQILSAGFCETGTAQGLSLEEEIAVIAKRGIRVIGPNCFGIYCPKSGLTMLPGADLSRRTGPVGFISQSGGMSVDFAYMGKWAGVRFSRMISIGNGVDLRETELLEDFGRDTQTGIISMYIEGVRDGRGFFRALKSVSAEKPVIVYKGGLSDAGARAVHSHTASMAGSQAVWRGVLAQAGAVQVESLEEMAQASLAFSLLPHREYHCLCVAGGGGALGVNACDLAARYAFDIPAFDKETKARIEALLPAAGSSASNPVDLANPYATPEIIRDVLLLAAGDERIDIFLVIVQLYYYEVIAAQFGGVDVAEVSPHAALCEVLAEVEPIISRPVVVVIPEMKKGKDSMGLAAVQAEARDMFIDHGISVFDSPENAMRAIHHVSVYAQKRKHKDDANT
ncbi:MAG: CoA-binding protein [Thermodesulfobacteriota bacterium]|nr:CoA-binding protein [Thermodesulfobacteriota bacterium]